MLQAMSGWLDAGHKTGTATTPPPSIPPESETGEEYETLTQKKTKEEIRKLQIANEQAIRNLIEKTMIKSMLKEVGHGLQTNFVDVSRRESPTLAAKWGIPEREREVEQDLSKLIQAGLVAMIGEIERLADDGTFE